MMHSMSALGSIEPVASPLVLCDRLLTLAKEVDRAGLRGTAEHLLSLVSEVLEPVHPAARRHS
jgi:hypothetical protein